MEEHANLSRDGLSARDDFGGLIGESTPMVQLFDIIARVSQGGFSVLIQGETGTGKELVARCIHMQGPRRGKPLVPVDCSALSPTLVESELFGHVKGAFTGADQASLLSLKFLYIC
jgi:transcriptional regulator with GAF, ATPase, and Fis domain